MAWWVQNTLCWSIIPQSPADGVSMLWQFWIPNARPAALQVLPGLVLAVQHLTFVGRETTKGEMHIENDDTDDPRFT